MYYQINQSAHQLFKRIFSNRLTYYLLLILTFLEASIWFIIPDFFILMFSYFIDKNRYKYILGFVLSTIIGIVFYTYFVFLYKELAFSILLNIPFVTESMIESTNLMLHVDSFKALLTQSISGIPVKVWTYSVIDVGISIPYFIILVSISRTLRIFFIVFLGDVANKFLSNIIRNHFLVIFTIYLVAFFTGLYLIS